MSDFVTGFHTKNGVKKYDYNALANKPESVTDVTNTVISPNADYAEVGEWFDGNPGKENRLGYFVTIAAVGDNTIKIRKATSADDIRGVSVYNPAFSGNASKAKYGEDGELLPRYNYIGVMGIVKVIDHNSCTVGGRCMSADDGTAIPSTNNMGYAVLERVDDKHVLIAVEPGADMIQRIKTDVEELEKKPSGGGLTEQQLTQFNALVKWYEEQTYKEMTASISPSGATYELGSKQTITFTWSFSEEVSAVTFNGEAQEAAKTGSKKVENITASGSYQVKGTRADGKKEEKKATSTINFHNRFYWGYAADPRDTGGKLDSAFIKSVAAKGSKGFASGRGITFNITCDSGTYIWYAYPARFGVGKTSMAPRGSTMYFEGGFEAPELVSVTNDSGYTEDYYVYRSINPALNQSVKVT